MLRKHWTQMCLDAFLHPDIYCLWKCSFQTAVFLLYSHSSKIHEHTYTKLSLLFSPTTFLLDLCEYCDTTWIQKYCVIVWGCYARKIDRADYGCVKTVNNEDLSVTEFRAWQYDNRDLTWSSDFLKTSYIWYDLLAVFLMGSKTFPHKVNFWSP